MNRVVSSSPPPRQEPDISSPPTPPPPPCELCFPRSWRRSAERWSRGETPWLCVGVAQDHSLYTSQNNYDVATINATTTVVVDPLELYTRTRWIFKLWTLWRSEAQVAAAVSKEALPATVPLAPQLVWLAIAAQCFWRNHSTVLLGWPLWVCNAHGIAVDLLLVVKLANMFSPAKSSTTRAPKLPLLLYNWHSKLEKIGPHHMAQSTPWQDRPIRKATTNSSTE